MFINPSVTDWNKLLNTLKLDANNLENTASIDALLLWCQTNIQSNFTNRNLKSISDLFASYNKLNSQASLETIVDPHTGAMVIHQAAKLGFDNFINKCLKHYPEKEVKRILLAKTTSNENTPLHLAALQGNLSTVDLLLEDYGADANVWNKNHKLPIHLAAINNLAAGKPASPKPAPLNQKEEPSNHGANQAGSKLACIRALLGATTKENLLEHDEIGSFLLAELVSFDNLHIINDVLAKNPEQLYLQNSRGENILHLAALKGKHELAKHFKKNEQLMKAKTNNSSTVLHLVCRYGDQALIEQFLGNKNLNQQKDVDEHGKTPLDYLNARKDLDNISELTTGFNQSLTF